MWGRNKKAVVLAAVDRFDRAHGGILDRIEALESAPAPVPSPALPENYEADIETRLALLEKELKHTNLAVGEGIERVDRADRRIKATVARARKELADRGYEDPGLEAEAHELHLVDGDGGEEGGVPAVHGDVAAARAAGATEWSSVKGVPAATLRKVRGGF